MLSCFSGPGGVDDEAPPTQPLLRSRLSLEGDEVREEVKNRVRAGWSRRVSCDVWLMVPELAEERTPSSGGDVKSFSLRWIMFSLLYHGSLYPVTFEGCLCRQVQ